MSTPKSTKIYLTFRDLRKMIKVDLSKGFLALKTQIIKEFDLKDQELKIKLMDIDIIEDDDLKHITEGCTLNIEPIDWIQFCLQVFFTLLELLRNNLETSQDSTLTDYQTLQPREFSQPLLSPQTTTVSESNTDSNEHTPQLCWVYPKKGDKSRTEWREPQRALKKRKISELEWREAVQRIEQDVPALVKGRNTPFPRLTELPSNATSAKIVIKGKEDEKDLLKGDEVMVNTNSREAEFPQFQIMKSSYNERTKQHENWQLVFQIYDTNRNLIGNPIETRPTVVYSHVNQLQEWKKLKIDSIIPSKGEINQSHKFVLLGSFKFDPSLKVFLGDQPIEYEYNNEGTIVVQNVSSSTPSSVELYIKLGERKSNSLFFTFELPTPYPPPI